MVETLRRVHALLQQPRDKSATEKKVIGEAVMIFEPKFVTRTACRLLGVSSATLYRSRTLQQPGQTNVRRSHRRISESEYSKFHDVLHEERFIDLSFREIYVKLLNEGTYLFLISTMSRLLFKLGKNPYRQGLAQHQELFKRELIDMAKKFFGSGIT